MRRATGLLVVILMGATSGCGGRGTDDEPIRYPHITQPAPVTRTLPAWIPARLAGRLTYDPGLAGPCHVLYGDRHGDQVIDRAPRGGCRTALEVVAAFDDRFGRVAICDQDACPPRTHVVRGWRCRLTSWFDDVYEITCRRHGHVIGFGGGG